MYRYILNGNKHYLRRVDLSGPLYGGQLLDDVEHAVEGGLLEARLLEAVDDGAQEELLVARARPDSQDLGEYKCNGFWRQFQ